MILLYGGNGLIVNSSFSFNFVCGRCYLLVPLVWLRRRKNLTKGVIGESQGVSMSSPGPYLIRRKARIY